MKPLFYFTAVFDEDGPITSEGSAKPATGHVCRSCKEPTAVLHHDPDRPNDCRRVICGRCQGDANRQVLGHVNPVSKESRHGY